MLCALRILSSFIRLYQFSTCWLTLPGVLLQRREREREREAWKGIWTNNWKQINYLRLLSMLPLNESRLQFNVFDTLCVFQAALAALMEPSSLLMVHGDCCVCVCAFRCIPLPSAPNGAPIARSVSGQSCHYRKEERFWKGKIIFLVFNFVVLFAWKCSWPRRAAKQIKTDLIPGSRRHLIGQYAHFLKRRPFRFNPLWTALRTWDCHFGFLSRFKPFRYLQEKTCLVHPKRSTVLLGHTQPSLQMILMKMNLLNWFYFN